MENVKVAPPSGSVLIRQLSRAIVDPRHRVRCVADQLTPGNVLFRFGTFGHVHIPILLGRPDQEAAVPSCSIRALAQYPSEGCAIVPAASTETLVSVTGTKPRPLRNGHRGCPFMTASAAQGIENENVAPGLPSFGSAQRCP